MSGRAALEREGHVGLVYPTAQVRDETVVAFVGDGLRPGEHVVLDTWDQGWESALAQHGVDTRRSAEDGSLTALAAPHFFPAGWALPQTLRGQHQLAKRLVGRGAK